MPYDLLLKKIARECEGFSGASLAGVARAAASHALERAVIGFSSALSAADNHEVAIKSNMPLSECLVTLNDLKLAVEDVKASSGDSDWSEHEEENNDESPSDESGFD